MADKHNEDAASKLNRRDFLRQSGLAAGAWSLSAAFPFADNVLAAEQLTAVEWGAPWIDASNTINQGTEWDGRLRWELHQGGAAAILPKIKGAWPNPPYDMTNVWTPVFLSMIREGWAETVTVDDVPHLADVPEDLITKDADGNWKNIPRSISGTFFIYRPDLCPIELKTIEDLLDPKLTGQITWPTPTLNTNLQTVNLALARGGDEHNMQPGWEFLEELAKSGNIARVANAAQDVLTSFTTGETCVSFVDQATAATLAERIPVEFLAKTDPSFKTFPFTEGWVVLNSSTNKQAAFDYANFTISPKACEVYNAEIGAAPTNTKSEPTEGVAHMSMTSEELEEYAHLVDYEHVSSSVDAWNKKFETEILPLLG